MEGSNLDEFARASVHADLREQWSDRIEACADGCDMQYGAVLDVLHAVLRGELARRKRPLA